MGTSHGITEMFGSNLAELLSEKILAAYPKFKSRNFVRDVEHNVVGRTYTERVAVIAELLDASITDIPRRLRGCKTYEVVEDREEEENMETS